jgi:hypothetical protein
MLSAGSEADDAADNEEVPVSRAAVASGLGALQHIMLSAEPVEVRVGSTTWQVSRWPHDRPPCDGEHVAVSRQTGQTVTAGLGEARVVAQRDASTGALLTTLVLTGAGANAELSFTESEWAAFRPFGLAERI